MLAITIINTTFAETYNNDIPMKRTMKKLASYCLLMMLTTTILSCEDDDIAQSLDGIWEGEVATEYFSYRWGTQIDYQAVDIEFYADPYRYAKGTGVEYDYMRNSYRYIESFFSFEVRNGRIYLDYDDGSHVAIYNYRLSNNHFTGEFQDAITGRHLADFNFIKVSDWRHNRYSRSSELQYEKIPSPLLKE